MAVVSARRVRLQRGAELGRAGAKIALELKRDPGRFLSTVQIGITVIGVLASALGGATFADALAEYLAPLGLGTKAGPISFTIVVVVISYLTLILGELVPKRAALSRPEAIARGLAPMLALMTRLAAPLVWFLAASSNIVLHFLPRGPKNPRLSRKKRSPSCCAKRRPPAMSMPPRPRSADGAALGRSPR